MFTFRTQPIKNYLTDFIVRALFLIALLGYAFPVFGQTDQLLNISDTPTSLQQAGSQNPSASQNENQNAAPADAVSALNLQQNTPTTVTTKKGGGEPDKGNEVINFLGGKIMLPIAGSFMSAGGWLFDTSIREFILEMRTNLSTKAIQDLWKIVRDIVNLAFVFGFVYIGIRTIIDPGRSNTKAFLSQLIIAALLINFSLFLVRFITDVGNIASVEIYNTISINDTDGNPDIASGYAAAMGVLSIYQPDSMNGQKLAKIEGSMAFYIMASLLLIVAGFVFAAGAFLLFSRFVALTLLMIFSPLIFAAMVFPQLGKTAGGVLGKVINYSFFAPIYLFMLYLSFHVLEGSKALLGGGEADLKSMFVGETAGQITSIDTIMYFCLAIALLVASLQVAKMAGVYGGDKSMSMLKDASDRVRKGTVNVAQGTAGLVGRNSVGRYGDMRAKALEERGVPTTSLRYRSAKAMADSKFGSNFSRTQIREAGEKADAKKARYNQVQNIENAVDANAQIGGTESQVYMEQAISGASNEQLLKLLDKHKPGSPVYNAIVSNISGSQHDAILKAKEEDMNDEAKKEFKKQRTAAVKKKIVSKAQADYTRNNPGQTLDEDKALEAGLKDASIAQLQALGSDVVAPKAVHLKQSQFDDYIKKTDSETESQMLKDSRKKGLIAQMEPKIATYNTAVQSGVVNPESPFKGIKDKEIAKLPKEILLRPELGPAFTGGILKQILDDDALSSDDRQTIKDNIANGHIGNISANNFLGTPNGQNF